MPARGSWLALALGLTLGAGAALARAAAEPSLAETTLSRVMSARSSVLADCGFDILKESPLGDVTCKSGTRTAVEVWDEALTRAGLAPSERAGLGERLGLVPTPGDEPAGLWRADPRDVGRLVANLRLKAGG